MRRHETERIKGRPSKRLRRINQGALRPSSSTFRLFNYIPPETYLDEKEIRDCISDAARELGLRIKSLQRNPLTKLWCIDFLGLDKQIRFKPTPDANPEECMKQLKKHMGYGPYILEEEIENLRLRERDTMGFAMQRLKAIGDSAVDPLIQALLNESDTPIFRARVADTLAEIGNPKAVNALIQGLKDPDTQVRWSAVQALAKIGDERAIQPLEQVAGGSVSMAPFGMISVREDAQKAIKQIEERTKKV